MFGRFKKRAREWPFDQPKNCAVLTLRQVLEGESPILIVYHDSDDEGWQFVSDIEYTMDDARVVGLEAITELDPTLFQVAGLEPGHHAWRNRIGDKWTIEKTPEEPSE